MPHTGTEQVTLAALKLVAFLFLNFCSVATQVCLRENFYNEYMGILSEI